MFKIDNIKNYIISSKQDDFIKITNAIYDLTTHLNETYPGYKK